MTSNFSRTLTTLIPCVLSLACCSVYAEETKNTNTPITIIQPEKSVKKAEYAAIDTEKFEFGVYTGSLSVEDFGNSSISGLSFNYHINPEFMAQINYAKSEVGSAAFEDTLGNRFLSDDDKEFNIISASIGYRVFNGRSFFWARNKFNSNIYLIAGIENIEFAGETNTGFLLGTSYKLVLTDWLTGNIDLRNHIVNREFLSNDKTTQNIEVAIGFNVLF